MWVGRWGWYLSCSGILGWCECVHVDVCLYKVVFMSFCSVFSHSNLSVATSGTRVTL